MNSCNLSSKTSHTTVIMYIGCILLGEKKTRYLPNYELYLHTSQHIYFFIINQMQNSDHATMSFIMYGFFKWFPQSVHTQGKISVLFNILELAKLITAQEGKIIPKTCLTWRPVHLPTTKNMEMDMIDRLSPIWAFIHHHSITLLQAQISSTFLANNH